MPKEFSSHQKRLIKDYYENLDKIALARLSELVSKIYLAESESKKDILWKQVESALKKLKIPEAIAQHIIKTRNPEILAKNLNDWMK
ncbi:MAG: hypothetical protein A2173_09330 [Planctomycetes bacterium RBG_13_44_8b]|nr:MAG: hypothetical protein A2173_09330 [Planctomycetes bacterium RBG_13_44_8b]